MTDELSIGIKINDLGSSWMILNGVSRDCPKFVSTRYYLKNA